MIAEAVDAVKALNLQCVGLCGVSGAGKDTVYERVLQQLGFVRLGFAYPFKMRVVAEAHATLREAFHDKPRHVRGLLQAIGEGTRQQFGDDIWCDYFLTWVHTMHELMGLAVRKITVIDVRYPNEIACIKAIGGKILHLEPPTRSLFGDQAQHISETAFEAVIARERDAYVFNAKIGLVP